MATILFAPFSLNVVFDGTSTTFVWDAYDAIAAVTYLNNRVPTAVIPGGVGGFGGPTYTGTLSGTVVTLTFSTAPTAGATNLGVNLEF